MSEKSIKMFVFYTMTAYLCNVQCWTIKNNSAMKKIFAMLMAVAAISMVACAGQQKPAEEAVDVENVEEAACCEEEVVETPAEEVVEAPAEAE